MKVPGAGEDFFKMFSYPLIKGNPSSALKDINSIAIYGEIAAIFFDTLADAISKTISYENKFDFKVTVVFENVLQNSTLWFDFLLSWAAQKKILEWSSNNF